MEYLPAVPRRVLKGVQPGGDAALPVLEDPEHQRAEPQGPEQPVNQIGDPTASHHQQGQKGNTQDRHHPEIPLDQQQRRQDGPEGGELPQGLPGWQRVAGVPESECAGMSVDEPGDEEHHRDLEELGGGDQPEPEDRAAKALTGDQEQGHQGERQGAPGPEAAREQAVTSVHEGAGGGQHDQQPHREQEMTGDQAVRPVQGPHPGLGEQAQTREEGDHGHEDLVPPVTQDHQGDMKSDQAGPVDQDWQQVRGGQRAPGPVPGAENQQEADRD